MDRWARYLVTAVLVVAMVSPALDRTPDDGFPLSTYPMFAVDRGTRAVISTAVGATRSGRTVRLSPALLAGTDEPILAVRTARSMANQDPEGWCDEVALRVERLRPASGDDPIVEVRVVTETHDTRASLLDGAAPVGVLVHARCEVAS